MEYSLAMATPPVVTLDAEDIDAALEQVGEPVG
jgi:hypothetical protein